LLAGLHFVTTGWDTTRRWRAVVRKIIESTLVSLDGVIGDPQVWANDYFDKEGAWMSNGAPRR
jgi:hypothetical protein